MSFKDYNSRTNRIIQPWKNTNGKRKENKRPKYIKTKNLKYRLFLNSLYPFSPYNNKTIEQLINTDTILIIDLIKNNSYQLDSEVLEYLNTFEPASNTGKNEG